MTDISDEKEEGDNKYNPKELYYSATSVIIIKKANFTGHQYAVINIPHAFHTIESPPPDNKG